MSKNTVMTGLTAIGASQLLALQLNANANVFEISAGAGLGCSIPLLPSGSVITIRNDTGGLLNVYPSIFNLAGVITAGGGQINSLGANNPLVMMPTKTVTITYISQLLAYTSSNSSISQSGAISSAPTGLMTLDQSGGLFTVAQTSAYDIVIPTPAVSNAGLNYRFVIGTAGAFTIRIRNAAGTLLNKGVLVLGGPTVVTASGTNVNILTGAAVVGDSIDVHCDGINWFVRGYSSAAAGLSVS